MAQKEKTLDACAWDELVKNSMDKDLWAMADFFPERTWPATVAYPKLLAYARYVNGF
ncbi:predicted protein [Pyrenophora tritici-repentis Pt-1C-BFP]|uniref:Uncharacterized protein n=1 Tax=Pyrenophora tritici-repentis (strain Pt-1C-BFP) TaxID=426418 RepID=B2W175_PYRTR|nr:uncharacterized protein PTRG_04210 [Pyrenophora tritici-repentis Pt-1C-BFP]EDU47048.1 predicted protein [Pyrenophora tritici-repentis Pt-1C-BFP]